MVVRFLIEGCVKLGLVALITIRTADNTRLENAADTVDIIFAYICIICLCLAPLYMLYVGRRLVYRPLGMTDAKRNSLEQLFKQYKPKDFRPVCFSAVFFIRRFFILVIITFLPLQGIA